MCLAIPGEILKITDTDPVTRSGDVSFGGVVKEVSLALVPEAAVGDYVIVHAGFALNLLDEDEARTTLDYIRQIEDLQYEDDVSQ